MDHFSITKIKEGFHIDGFPDAVKVFRIAGPKARRLADLALHKADLDFALECVEKINLVPEQPYALRQALWRSGIVHFMKCFGESKSRFSLDPKKVYKGDAGASESYGYFRSLRDKHLVHGENSYAQCLPGAVLNRREMGHKIAKIVCLSFIGDTLSQDNYSNLHLLITRARGWVVTQFDELCNIITSDLELESYDGLLSREGVTYSPPKLEEIREPRSAL